MLTALGLLFKLLKKKLDENRPGVLGLFSLFRRSPRLASLVLP